jgi:hypothetical protein
MYFPYLKLIEENAVSKPGYIIKQVESVLGAHDEDGTQHFRTHSSYYLSYPEELHGYTFEKYILDLEEFVKSHEHKYSESIAHILTLIFIHIRDKSPSTQLAWSKFSQQMFTKCDLHLEYPIIGMSISMDEQLHLLNYDIGNFDVLSLKNKIIDKTQSDYWDRFKKKNDYSEVDLKHFLSFRRLDNDITVFNVLLVNDKNFFNKDERTMVIDLYFEALTIQYFRDFWTELDDQLVDSLAFGGAYYSPKTFQELTVGRCTQVGIFTNISGNPKLGWVIPLTHAIYRLHFDAQNSIPEINNRLKEYYESVGDESTEFLHPIKFIVYHLGYGLKLLYDEKVEEAFINFWLPLDSILNSNQNSRAFKNRVAALIWLKFKSDHQKQFDLMNQLYKCRNSFVHNGNPIERDMCLKLREISQAILDVLIIMHCKSINNEAISKKPWLEDIDKSYELFYKGQRSDLKLLKDIGVLTELTE